MAILPSDDGLVNGTLPGRGSCLLWFWPHAGICGHESRSRRSRSRVGTPRHHLVSVRSLSPIDAGADCISIADVAHEQLFPRVAAVVHPGGAGTTTAAARAGEPQVIVPHRYDQYYWAHRVENLGVGVSVPHVTRLCVDRLAGALRRCLTPETTARALTLAFRIELRGARIAAERLIEEFG